MFSYLAIAAKTGADRAPPVLAPSLDVSDDLGGQADDLHELAVAQLAGDGAEDAGAAGFVVVVDQDDGVAVEPDIRAVDPAGRVADPDHDATDDVARLDLAAGGGLLDAGDDHVAQPGGPPLVVGGTPAEDLEAHDFLGPG